jgi:hypothetical protein
MGGSDEKCSYNQIWSSILDFYAPDAPALSSRCSSPTRKHVQLLLCIALVIVGLSVQAMSAIAGNFFPPEYKQFPFKAGDLLVKQSSDGRFSITKILKVDRFDFMKGSAINIQGKWFVVTEDDYLLVVSVAYGEGQFGSFEEARAAALSGTWKVTMGHMPFRTPGASEAGLLVGNVSVSATELSGYEIWRTAFERGDAGIF